MWVNGNIQVSLAYVIGQILSSTYIIWRNGSRDGLKTRFQYEVSVQVR